MNRMRFFAILQALAIHPSSSSHDVHSASYISLPASQKQSKLWENCLEDSTPATWFSTFKMAGLLLEKMCPTFTTPGDELPYENFFTGYRDKYIHSVGVVGKVEWRTLGNHPYTGIFEGASHGIARLSLAAKPDPTKLTTTPGMGLKFLRNDIDSANLVAMFSVNGQESWNFFKNNFSNHIPEIDSSQAALASKFASATLQIRQVGLSDWGRYGQDGAERTNPVFPFRLRFEPTGEIEFSDAYTRPFTEDLKTLRAETLLYRVFALDKPPELGGKEARIGDLLLSSEMRTSKWGDRRMLFRHQDMEEDLVIKEEWRRYTPKFKGFVLGSSGCPSK